MSHGRTENNRIHSIQHSPICKPLITEPTCREDRRETRLTISNNKEI